ncbi:MAG: DUF6037 family protein [Bacteroides xylanisolvens]
MRIKRLPVGQHKSIANTEKTRILFPKIYERIKNRTDISICYTPIPNNREDEHLKR